MRRRERETALYAQAMKIAVPAMVESIFVSMVGIIDSVMVSALGTYAVAAVGLCNQPKLASFSLFFALNSAVSSLVARRRGEGEKEAVCRILRGAVGICLVGGIVIGGTACLFANEIMEFCGSEQETHREAVLYFRIIMGGILFQVLPQLFSAAMRGCGKTWAVMKINLFSQCINLVGNYLLIEGRGFFPALGVAGAAVATVFSCVVSLVFLMAAMSDKDSFISLKGLMRPGAGDERGTVKNIGRIGLPLFAEQILMRIGFLATAIIAADFGADEFAVNHAGMNIFTLTYAFGEGMQVAVVAMTGRSLGEKDIGTAKKYVKVLLRLGVILAAVIAVFYIMGAGMYMGFYFHQEELLRIGSRIMYVNAVIVFAQMIQQISTGSLKGGGDVLFITWSTIVSVTFVRPIATYFFCYTAGWGIMGFWYGMLLDQSIRSVLNTWRYKRGIWTGIQI